jgi:hypothetical protein
MARQVAAVGPPPPAFGGAGHRAPLTPDHLLLCRTCEDTTAKKPPIIATNRAVVLALPVRSASARAARLYPSPRTWERPVGRCGPGEATRARDGWFRWWTRGNAGVRSSAWLEAVCAAGRRGRPPVSRTPGTTSCAPRDGVILHRLWEMLRVPDRIRVRHVGVCFFSF